MKTPHDPKTPGRGRRDFLKAGGVSIAANLAYTALPPGANAESAGKTVSPAEAVQDMMPTRNLGKTGFRVGIFGLGGQGALEKTNNEAIAVPVFEEALGRGVTEFCF